MRNIAYRTRVRGKINYFGDWRPALFVPAAGIEVVDYLSIEKSHEDSGRTNRLVGGTFPMTESSEYVLNTGRGISIDPGLRCVSDR